MIALFKNIDYEHILIFDAEYNEGDLIQFAGLLFRKIDKDIFQIEKSFNTYVKLEEGKYVNRFIQDFTGITNSFLDAFGISLTEAKEGIEDLLDVEGSLLVVAHGLENDRRVLIGNNIDLYLRNDEVVDGMCTYNAAKRLLNRDKKLNLTDVAADAGVFLSNGHNAFDDAWATVSVFCLLRKLEDEKKNEELLSARQNENQKA